METVFSFIAQFATWFQEFSFSETKASLLAMDWAFWGLLILAILLSPFLVLFSLKLTRWALSGIYDFRYSKKRVFMEVTMPREESQKDKENATDKDFREKVAIMEQLFRALHEMHELNLSNKIMVWLFERDTISFEMHAKFKEITFYASVHPYYAEILEKQITSYYSNANVDYKRPEDLSRVDAAGVKSFVKMYYMYLKNLDFLPIKSYKTLENDPLNNMTNVLSKLEEGERAVIQLMLKPEGNNWQKEAREYATRLFKGKDVKDEGAGLFRRVLNAFTYVFGLFVFGTKHTDQFHGPGAKDGDSYVRMLQTEEEFAKRIGEKANQVGFSTVLRLGVSSPKGESRCDDILNGIFVGFNAVKDAQSNWFESRRLILLDSINSAIMKLALNERVFRLFEKKSLLSAEEIATMFHFPSTRYNYTPVIKWLAYKVLPPPNNLPTEGILLGKNVYRGVSKEVRFQRKDRRRHHYIIGQTGTGKSSFISYMARQDVLNGDGVCVIDPHGDLVEEILAFVPKERVKDVIIFNPADKDRPMGLNMLEARNAEQQDLASSQATEIFIKIFGDEIFGPRIQHYFRNACLTLMEDEEEGATLIDVPRIFVDDAFMKHKVSKVKNPVVKSFWDHEYANTGDRERQEMIPYFSSKFGPFITNSIMRNTIGQAKSAFNIRDIMDGQKILLVNLSKGRLGTLNTQLLGLVLVAQIQMAAMSRVDTPEDERKDFYLYVDEFQNFATDTFCSILSEARKYKLNLIMAHQYINQLVVSKNGGSNSQIRDAVFGNVGTLQTFKVGAEDAEYFAKEYAPVLTEQDIIGIANYKSYLKLNINMATSRPFSMDTIYDMKDENKKIREIVKQYSALKYGRKKEFVDKEIEARIGIDLSKKDENTDGENPEAVYNEGETPEPQANVEATPTADSSTPTQNS